MLSTHQKGLIRAKPFSFLSSETSNVLETAVEECKRRVEHKGDFWFRAVVNATGEGDYSDKDWGEAPRGH